MALRGKFYKLHELLICLRDSKRIKRVPNPDYVAPASSSRLAADAPPRYTKATHELSILDMRLLRFKVT
jgi:hypothetical protein